MSCRFEFRCAALAAPVLVLLLNLCATLSARAAPPVVKSLFPAGGQRGTQVSVKADGTFAAWPPQIVVDRPGVTLEPGEKKGELTAHIAADAEPGVYLVRLYDDHGAAAARPFVVGVAPEAAEKETNDRYQQPQAVQGPAVVVNGVLNKNGDVDIYAVQVQAGQVLVAAMRANSRLGSPMDGVLQVVSPEGFVLAQNDDSCGMDPMLAFPVREDGVYLVRTFGFPETANSSIRYAGAADFIYRLAISTGPTLDHPWPLAVHRESPGQVALQGWNIPADAPPVKIGSSSRSTISVSPEGFANFAEVALVENPVLTVEEPPESETPAMVKLPITVSGRIDSPGDVDEFRFTGVKGQRIRLTAESYSLGFPLDPHLELFDSEGKSLVKNDDEVRNEGDSLLSYTLRADGEYRVQIRDLYQHGGPRYVYRLTMTEAAPDFALSVTADTLLIPAGKPLEVTVTVNRLEGFNEEIEITADGLPEGVKVEAAKSEAKGATAKSVKLKFTAGEEPQNGPIQIIGRSAGESKLQRNAAATVAGKHQLTDLWLTVPAKSEKKE